MLPGFEIKGGIYRMTFKNTVVLIVTALFLWNGQSLLGEPPKGTPSGRGFMGPSVTSIPGGAEVTAAFHLAALPSTVTLNLVAEVTDDKGDQHLIVLKKLDDNFVYTNDYQPVRKFQLDYDQINQELKALAPNANLKVAPGMKMWVHAKWANGHRWGGTDRGGEIILPAAANSSGNSGTGIPQTSGFTQGGDTTSLDVANQIGNNLAVQYPGLPANGTVGSRFEKELKLHVDLADFPRVEKLLVDLAADPAQVQKLFGAGSQMKEDTTYVNQPMIDNYLDNKQFDGAKKGMALRLRTGKGVTSINYKPTDGFYEGNGVYARIEYQGEGIGNAQSIKSFMDSSHRMNPFQVIRDKIPGTAPSDFLNPAVRITDKRRKFKLALPGGEEVEFSLDRFLARSLDPNGNETGPVAEVAQLEVEVDHLAVGGSKNISNTPPKGSKRWYSSEQAYEGTALASFMNPLGAQSHLSADVPPIFHGEKDLQLNSAMRTANAATFQSTQAIFDKVVSHLFGSNWNSSGQKYAVAAAALGLVPMKDAAPSVKRMLQERTKDPNMSESAMSSCLLAMVKVSQVGLP